MTTEKQQPMSEQLPTLLIVYQRPAHKENALFHIGEALYRRRHIIAQQEERVSLESAVPFVFTHNEKLMVCALRHRPLMRWCDW
jgi:hypothetical protein